MCRSLEEQLANLECNATSAMSITHHFLTIMVRTAMFVVMGLNHAEQT